MYKEIIKKNWKSGSEEIMNKSVDMVAELLEEMKEVCPKKYWWFIRKQHGLMSGGHYDEDFARYDVKQMYHVDKRGNKVEGEYWSMEQARQVMQENGIGGKNTVEDVYVAKRLKNTTIFCRDAIRVIEAVDGEDVLHYCDPPYFNSDCGHYSGYSEEDFVALLDCLSAVKGKFVLSSYPSEVLDRYVKKYGWKQERIEMARSAGFCEGVKVEVLTWNFEDSCGKQGELFE